MNKLEAEQLAGSTGNDEMVNRPQATNPDTRSVVDQLHSYEIRNFERRLAAHALRYEKANNGAWPENKWFANHRRKFAHHLQAAQGRLARVKNYPCKHWKSKLRGVDPAMLRQLDAVWSAALPVYARQLGYLATPTAPCWCKACGGAPVTVETYDWNTPLEGMK
jgi:hypothetical protein